MESYEVLKQALAKRGIKAIASEMGLSESLLYKWSQEAGETSDSDKSGVKNPLDRTVELYTRTGDPMIVQWVCQQANGFFVQNPHGSHDDIDATVFRDTQEMIEAFSILLKQVSNAIENGDGVDAQEARHIRREWEDLKRIAEAFVVRCEKGRYYKGDSFGSGKK